MFVLAFAARAFLVATVLPAPQDHLVSLGRGAFDTRWNDDTYKSVCAGEDYSLLIRSDDTVRVFGYQSSGSQTPPPGTYIALATSEGYVTSGGIRSDGTIAIWGPFPGNIGNVPSLPPGMSYVALALSSDHAAAVRSDGAAVTWGTNDFGRLDIPALPPGLAYTRVAVGGYHTLALRSDGALLGAGFDDDGAHLPPALPQGTTYVDVDTSTFHSLAARSDGQVVAFGNNDFDECEVPPLPPGLTYISVAARLFSSVALRSDGALVAWGSNEYGTLVPPPGLSFIDYSLGDNHLLALCSDGRIVSAGDTSQARRNVASVPAGRRRLDIELGSADTIIPTILGARLDDGSYEGLIDNRPPLVAPAGIAFVQLAMARDSRVGLRNDGKIQVNGLNYSVPALPAGLLYTAVAAGGQHILALRSDGALVAWGTNTSGQCNVPALPGGTSYVGCAGGGAHSLALRSDGALVAFGNNTFGQLAVPALPPGVSYVEAWGGCDFSLARRSDGVLVTFGRNDLGQCDVPAPPPGTDYRQVACGAAHVAALRSDGTVVLWGSGQAPAGELAPPGGGLAYLELAAYGDETVARLGPPLPTSGPILTSVSPAAIEALTPGTDQTVTLAGARLDTVTGLLLDGTPIDAARWTPVSASEITLDMPQLASLGGHRLGVTDGVDTHEFPLTLVAPLAARLELGTGDPLNVVDRDDGLRLRIGGPVGKVQYLYASLSNAPSTNVWVSLGIGNGFTNLFHGGPFVVPAAGWSELMIPRNSLPDPGLSGITFYSQTILFQSPRPFAVSNLQSFALVQ